MPKKFKFSYAEEIIHVMLVDADDEDQAHDLAMELMDGTDKTRYKKVYGKYSEMNIVEVPAETTIEESEPEFQ